MPKISNESDIYIYSMYVQNAVRAERLNVER